MGICSIALRRQWPAIENRAAHPLRLSLGGGVVRDRDGGVVRRARGGVYSREDGLVALSQALGAVGMGFAISGCTTPG